MKLDNNNINMNMNTGRAVNTFWGEEDPIFPNKDDIWSNENLSFLIDTEIVGCETVQRRRNFADSILLREELGGDFLSASCKAVRKMTLLLRQMIADNITSKQIIKNVNLLTQ